MHVADTKIFELEMIVHNVCNLTIISFSVGGNCCIVGGAEPPCQSHTGFEQRLSELSTAELQIRPCDPTAGVD